jgi:transcriptional regulator with XRE-family HTH domain
MQTIDQRIEALPPTCKFVIVSHLEYLEWKNRHAVGSYSTQGEKEEKYQQRRALGERLQAVRKALRQSIEEAAAVAGIVPETYERYERGIIGRWPTVKVVSYAETWNVSFAWLFEGTGSMFRESGPPTLSPTEPTEPTPRSKPRAAAPESNVVAFPRRLS